MTSVPTVSYQEHQQDASYITVSSRPTTDSEPGARVVKSMSLRAAITKGQMVRLGNSNKAGGPVKPDAFEVNKFFRRLSFKQQVRQKQQQQRLLRMSVCLRSDDLLPTLRSHEAVPPNGPPPG